ncbi:hypothetical protein DIPPA_25114 [Diplonema papillatum]|nr:hypothetical protein DIPPA_25114 [Diplonema papillatum]
MQRIVSPLHLLQREGCGYLEPKELHVVGREKSFQCLLMEERAKVKKEIRSGKSPMVFAQPGAQASPIGPPSLAGFGSPGVPSAVTPPVVAGPVEAEVECQTEWDSKEVATGTTETMQMGANRQAIIDQQADRITGLKEEVVRLEALLHGTAHDVMEYFNPQQCEWLLRHEHMLAQEIQQQRILDAAAVINERQFLREQRRVDRRTARRNQRYHVVQGRIDSVRDLLYAAGHIPETPYGSPPKPQSELMQP